MIMNEDGYIFDVRVTELAGVICESWPIGMLAITFSFQRKALIFS